MKKLELEKMEKTDANGTGSMCFFSPFRLLLAGGSVGGGIAVVSELAITSYCWNT